MNQYFVSLLLLEEGAIIGIGLLLIIIDGMLAALTIRVKVA